MVYEGHAGFSRSRVGVIKDLRVRVLGFGVEGFIRLPVKATV